MPFKKHLPGMMRQTGKLSDVGPTRSPIAQSMGPQSMSEPLVKDFLDSCMSSPLHIFSS